MTAFAFDIAVYSNEYGGLIASAKDQIIAGEYRAHNGWAILLVEFLRNRCFPQGEGVFVDVGAHVGLVTIPVARKHPKVRCLAFEPHPENFALLQANIQHNQCANVRPYARALGACQGTAALAVSAANTVDHRVGSQRHGAYAEETRAELPIQVTTLDEADVGLAQPLVVKIDAQGDEAAVLRGAQELYPTVVILEVWPYGLKRAGETLDSLIASFPPSLAYCAPLFSPGVQLQPRKHFVRPLLASVWADDRFSFDLVLARSPIP